MKTQHAPMKSPAHFMATDDGSLYDTRKGYSAPPIRPLFRRHFSEIKTTAQLKATLRAGENTWPGCYPLFFITSDVAALSFDSVLENLSRVLDSIRTKANDGWRVVACEVNWEDTSLFCDHSGKQIPSAYGDDNEE